MKLYNINDHISSDESMIPFKGMPTLKQYNPMKPLKPGYKVWAHADNDWYISTFSLYQGKHGENENFDAQNCFGLGEKVVIYLISDLFGKNYKLYLDTDCSFVPPC